MLWHHYAYRIAYYISGSAIISNGFGNIVVPWWGRMLGGVSAILNRKRCRNATENRKISIRARDSPAHARLPRRREHHTAFHSKTIYVINFGVI